MVKHWHLPKETAKVSKQGSSCKIICNDVILEEHCEVITYNFSLMTFCDIVLRYVVLCFNCLLTTVKTDQLVKGDIRSYKNIITSLLLK